jgi:hypothetical protein
VVLGGDVSGTAGDTTVIKIQGTNVANLSETGPSNGQLLTYFVSADPAAAEWRAMDPPTMGVLAGDVVGAPEANTVTKLYGTNVADFTEVGNVPEDGQVLKFVRAGDEPGRWEASDVPAPPPPDLTLAGDVEGAAGADATTTVRAIQGRPVADFSVPALAPTNGDVLTYVDNGDQPTLWYARTPRLDGDAFGVLNNTIVRALQNFLIYKRSGPVPYNEGDVLVFRSNAWQPEPLPAGAPTDVERTTTGEGSYVERPERLPAYSIVAAGTVRGDGTSRFPTYNNLKVRVAGAGAITVTFDGYVAPDENFQYVVKAQAVTPDPKNSKVPGAVINVMFQRFLTTAGLGFVLNVTAVGRETPLSEEEIGTLEFMIEVSRYETAVRE